MSDNKYNFLSRWSKRKIEAKRVEAGTATSPNPSALQRAPGARPEEAAAVRAEAGAPAAPVAETAAALPSLESLRGVASEYRDFLRPEVDEGLRREALKHLFHDPHFNVMDGLDTYIDDYSKPDPIPAAMLKALNHAQGLIFDREPETDKIEASAAGAEQAIEPPRAAAGDDRVDERAEMPGDAPIEANAAPVPAKPADAA